ncbi:Actin-related protein 2/3 complex subunit 2 [Histomonas meleagridis]|uniref:Actin-related protein 2/3 complex subunit 2 n=1 Tax=Histomonas meleagridis TaxID=135588 RepID=UPI003559DC2C|nr:Actin-related protein 2/3 complex subunit 2 [Histomonas meleagridis]KAH0797350.1 Actin-related protein 2/3 complex subunit 2 [Histomonas meleagridis]
MIILEFESAILRNLLERSLMPHEKLSGEYTFCDFDGVKFRLHVDKKTNDIEIHMYIGCAEELNEYGAAEEFEKHYGNYKIEPAATRTVKYTHAIRFNLSQMNEKEQKEMITLASRMKAHVLGAPFIFVADQVASKANFAPFEIPYRKATMESYFVTPTSQGAAATFSIRFSDPGDKIIAGVFFQELAAARTRVKSAPIVTYSNDPPADLGAFDLPTKDKNMYAYVTISLQSAQFSDRKKQDISFYLPMFRDYLHYHIKCAKAFMHQKMRARTASMLKILDAAKPEPKQKVRRTITGRIMK